MLQEWKLLRADGLQGSRVVGVPFEDWVLEKLQSKKFKPKIMKKLAEGSKKCNIYFLFTFHMVTNASFSTVIPLTHIDLQTLLNNRTYSPSSSMYNLYASLTNAHHIHIHGYTKFMQRQKYVYKHISHSHQYRHTVT